MRNNKRRRKTRKLNHKRIFGAILVLILIIVLAILGISNIKKGNNEIGTIEENEVEEEVVIPEDITINLVAIGDVMCHKTNYNAAYNSETGEYDFSSVFANVAKYITKADIAIRKLRNNFCRRR